MAATKSPRSTEHLPTPRRIASDASTSRPTMTEVTPMGAASGEATFHETGADSREVRDSRLTTTKVLPEGTPSGETSSRSARVRTKPTLTTPNGASTPMTRRPTKSLAATSLESSPPATKVNAISSSGLSQGSFSPAAIASAEPVDRSLLESNSPATVLTSMPDEAVLQGPNVPGPVASAVPLPMGHSLLDPALCLAADVLDDLERVRIANENRVRQMTRSATDADGEERGFGLDAAHPDVVKLTEIVANLVRLEHEAQLELQRRLRKHPLGAWVKATKGVGEKQGARLLAAIGDPYINAAKGAPRTVSALWAYCGLHVLPGSQTTFDDHCLRATGDQLPSGHMNSGTHKERAAGSQLRNTDQPGRDTQASFVGVAAKRKKGERANWSTKAKMRAYLIAESCIKQLHRDCRDGHRPTGDQGILAVPVQDHPQDEGQSPTDAPTLRAPSCGCSPYRVVYDRRRAHTATTHPEWSDGHSHNDALRVASKEILKDLWRAARDWHLKELEGRS